MIARLDAGDDLAACERLGADPNQTQANQPHEQPQGEDQPHPQEEQAAELRDRIRVLEKSNKQCGGAI